MLLEMNEIMARETEKKSKDLKAKNINLIIEKMVN